MRTQRLRAVGLFVLLPALLLLLAPLRPADAGFGQRRAGDPSKPEVLDVLDLLVYFDYAPDQPEYENWVRIFREFSEDLYDATETQLRLGKVEFTTCLSQRSKADIWIHQASSIACAAPQGLNKAGRWIHLYRVHQCAGSAPDRYAYANLTDCRDGESPVLEADCGGARGQFGLLHEAGHYLFGLGDEYEGRSRRIGPDGAAGEEVDVPHKFYCAHGETTSSRGRLNTSSVMDGGTATRGRNLRVEFCVSTSEGEVGHDELGHRFGEKTIIDGQTYQHTSEQETLNGGSCWDTLIGIQRGGTELVSLLPERERQAFLASRLFLTKFTTALPVKGQTLPTGADAVIEGITGKPGFMLLIDTSRSMRAPVGTDGSTRLDLAKRGAKSALGALRDVELIGMLSFDSEVSVFNAAAPIAAATSEWRAQLAAGIDGLPERGNTATGLALEKACEILGTLGPETVSSKSVILLSDGVNTVGKTPQEVLANPGVCRDIRIHTIALGPSADLATLKELAAKTGGDFYAVLDPAELTDILPRVLRKARGESFLLDVGDTVQPGVPLTREVLVSALAADATFQLTGTEGAVLRLDLTSPSGNDVILENGDACVFDPRKAADVCDIVYTVSGAGEAPAWTYLIPDPEPGTWKMTVTNLGPTPLPSGLLVTESAPRAAVDAAVRGPGVIQYPNPIPLEVSVVADTPVAGADVTAVVAAPGGASSEELQLFDDGSMEHGDRIAGDGIYSVLFYGYKPQAEGGGNGTYQTTVKVQVDCGTASTATGCLEDGELPVGELRIASFQATTQVSVVVTDVPPTFETGTVAFLSTTTDALVGPIKADETDVTPFMPFTLTAAGESVQLRSVTVTASGTADVTSVDEVSLFLDCNADGLPDNRSSPLAWTRFDASGVAVFTRSDGGTLALLLAGESTHFVLGFGSRRLPVIGAGQPKPAVPSERGLPLLPPPTWVLLLALLAGCTALVARIVKRPLRRPAGVATCAALVGVFLITGGVGCGGGDGGPTTSQLSIVSTPSAAAPGDYTVTLDPATVAVIGATSKGALPVSGSPFVQVIRVEASDTPPIVTQTVGQPSKRTHEKGGR